MRTSSRTLAALAGVAGVAVSVLTQATASDTLSQATIGLVMCLYIAVGLVIQRSRPGHLVGRLCLAGACIQSVGSGLLELSTLQLREHPADPLAGLGATVGSVGRADGFLILVLVLPLVFPDGQRGGPRRLVPWAWRVALVTMAVFTLQTMLSPYESDLRLTDVDNPVGLPRALAPVTDAMAGVALLLAVLTIALAITCVVSRWRYGSELRRQQLLWFGLAFAPPIALFLMSFSDSAKPWMFGVALVPFPVAIGFAVLQHRIYDVALAVNRSLTYATLWLVIAGLYAVTVGGVGALLRRNGAHWLPWVAAGVVAVSFAPLRDALQGAANKLTYGQWSEPGDVLAGIGRRLSDASDVPALLKTLSDELSQTLGLAYVEIVDASKTSLARTGEPETADEIPLLAYGTQVGMLRWSSRNLRDSDQGLLGDVANQLGSVVHAATLLQLVRTAQERLVAAREEERKRLRRDLHDGLGPALAALTLQVDTLRNQSAPADAELLKLRDGIQSTVLDVRRLVEGLRPPAIDELGLSEAVHQLAGRLSKHSELVVTVNANGLPVLPAAVEVAAYRIAQEALTNTVRHSEAHNCTVELAESDGVLVVRVVDDGNGAVAPRPGGLGLASMRERTEEIGGKFVVETSSGTAITARLPIGEAATP